MIMVLRNALFRRQTQNVLTDQNKVRLALVLEPLHSRGKHNIQDGCGELFAIAIQVWTWRSGSTRFILVYLCNGSAFLSLSSLTDEVSREYHSPVDVDAVTQRVFLTSSLDGDHHCSLSLSPPVPSLCPISSNSLGTNEAWSARRNFSSLVCKGHDPLVTAAIYHRLSLLAPAEA